MLTSASLTSWNFSEVHTAMSIKSFGNCTHQTLPCFTTDAPSTAPNDQTNPFEQTTIGIVLWSMVYSVMALVGLCGNLGICWIVLSVKRMRSVTNIFLASTAFADCNVIVFNTIFNFTFAVNGIWYFGVVFCHFINFLPVAAVIASISCITVISVDRFMLIMYPIRQRISHKTAGVIIAGIWIGSIAIAFPQSYFAKVETIDSQTVCTVDFPDGVWGTSRLIYQILFMILSYFLPLTVLAVSYVAMGFRLRGNVGRHIGYTNDSQMRKIRTNKKAVRMMTLVVVVFATCWFPYQMYFLIGFIYPGIFDFTEIQQVYLTVFWLAMSSAMYNPLIYCWRSKRHQPKVASQERSSRAANCDSNGLKESMFSERLDWKTRHEPDRSTTERTEKTGITSAEASAISSHAYVF